MQKKRFERVCVVCHKLSILAAMPRSDKCAKCGGHFAINNPNKDPAFLARLRDRNGVKNPNWNGGEHMDSKGYIKVLTPDHPRANSGYVAEHILVMEKSIGRFVSLTEVIHHINEDKSDNRIENLQLFSSSGAHVHHHFKNGMKREVNFSKQWREAAAQRMKLKNPMHSSVSRKKVGEKVRASQSRKTDFEKYESMRKMTFTRYGRSYSYEQWLNRKSSYKPVT